MQDFFDRFKPKNNNNNNNKNNNNNNNVLGNLLGGITKGGSFQGQGKSLGGSKKPGKVIPVQLSDPGSLGIHIEKRPVAETAIVGNVIPGSQAANAGLQRGDIICFQGSDGQEEILYSLFVELAKSNQRPLCFEIRRIETSVTKSSATTAASSSTRSSNNNNNNNKMSAEAFARKQAMIAAAEERERKNKQKTKPIKTGFVPKTSSSISNTNTTTTSSSNDTVEPPTIESQYAVELAKEAERRTIVELGYNPYEVNTSSAGRARNAVTNVTHGSIQNTAEPSSGTIPQITAPIDPTLSRAIAPTSSTAASSSSSTASLTATTKTLEIIPPPPEFDEIFETIVTTNTDHDAVNNSLSIICKLITNATTKKGTAQDTEKFRKVRLANPKIQVAVVNIHGAIDLLLLMGFQLSTEEAEGASSTSESILVYPPPTDQQPPYPWIPQAIQRLQNYCS